MKSHSTPYTKIYSYFMNFFHLCQAMMNPKLINWGLYVLLCIIWGSSFILMKEGLTKLNAWEVAALRMLSAGIILIPFAFKAFTEVKRKDLPVLLLSGLLGSFIPAILFCVAETRIDSALAGILNALTPFFVILVGISFFQAAFIWKKLLGVCVGFAGMIILFLKKGIHLEGTHMLYSSLILAATFCYGLNVNIISHYLKHINSMHIATIAFVSLIPFALVLLLIQVFFYHPFQQASVLWAVAASSILGIIGTAFASILFYMLLKRAGALFSSMVTYGIPFVAVGWGLLAGETITALQIGGLLIILSGVYIANK